MSATEAVAKEKKKKAKQINVSEELGDLYERQRNRLDALFRKEIEKNLPLKETTENVAVTMKMLELIHNIQSEKNIEDAIDAKDNRIDSIIAELDAQGSEALEKEEA